MGYNVWVQFSLDDLDGISDKKKRDAFCEELLKAIRSDEDTSFNGGYVHVIHKRHADVPVLMFSHCNSFMEISDYKPTFMKQHNILDKGIFYWAYMPTLQIVRRIVSGYTKLMMELKKEHGPKNK